MKLIKNPNKKRKLYKFPVKVVVIYLIFGFSWILFSDQLLSLVVSDYQKYKIIQSYKGIFYVLLTAALLFVLIKLDYNKIYALAFRDPLTSLKNRLVFEYNGAKKIEKGHPFTLYYLDLDHFKHLNDIHGHHVGDLFLKDYAKRLKTLLPDAELYRWSGDEFLILESKRMDVAVANQILEVTKRPWSYSHIEYIPSVSIGIASYPESSDSLDGLLKNTDLALFEAKALGRSTACIFDERFQQHVEKRLNIESLIRDSIKHDLFELYFQPIYDLMSPKGHFQRVEILLRTSLQSPDLGIGEVMQVAEENGQIKEIDRLVLDKVFKCIHEHCADYKGDIAINLSAKSIVLTDLHEYLEILSENYRVDSNRIEFELTEHSIIADLDQAKLAITNLKGQGFHLALDDFGTRYSSLNYLSQMPFSTLKIDKSYVDKMVEEEKAQKVVRKIIELAHDLGIKTVAEGVESLCQKELLIEMGCDFAQGYFFSKPLSQKDFLEIVKTVK